MIEKTEAGNYLPDNGKVLFSCKNGKVSTVRHVHRDEHVASVKAFVEMAQLAGYIVMKKGGFKL